MKSARKRSFIRNYLLIYLSGTPRDPSPLPQGYRSRRRPTFQSHYGPCHGPSIRGHLLINLCKRTFYPAPHTVLIAIATLPLRQLVKDLPTVVVDPDATRAEASYDVSVVEKWQNRPYGSTRLAGNATTGDVFSPT